MPIINSFSGASVRGYGFTSGAGKKILLSATPGPSATVTTYSGYIVFTFTSSGTLNVGVGSPGTADVLLVRGGSPGYAFDPSPPLVGRGGAGGALLASPGVTITANTPIPVTVGSASTVSQFGPLSSPSGTSGSGGAGGWPGSNGLPGGSGSTNNYRTGSNATYGGGGGGGGGPGGWPGGSGGAGGGGAGGPGPQAVPLPGGGPVNYPGTPGTANTGGAGGGGGGPGGVKPPGGGGGGGSGIVVARFPDAVYTV